MAVTVQRGDSMWAIAQRNHISLAALEKANPQVKNPSLIFSGQHLNLPGHGDTFAPPKAAPKPAPHPASTVAPKPGGYVAAAMAHPNAIFKQQFRSRFNPTGPLRSSNCSPASLAMAVKAFGLEPKGLTVEQSIDRARKQMTGNTNDHLAVRESQVRNGAHNLGLHAEAMAKGKLDAELKAGRMVVLSGRPVGDYRTAFHNYSDFYGGHSILVLGKTAKGYVVNDPLSRTGSVTLTAHQLAAYTEHGGTGTAVWR